MFYLIGLGLNEKSISLDGLEVLRKCDLVYLENYTVEFPYEISKLTKVIGKKIETAGRKEVEEFLVLKDAKKKNVALLIYGSPLFATTHIALINECIKNKVKCRIIYSASVFDAIASTGLQLYKFGKISSMPKWQKNFEPGSFLEYVVENRRIDAHSLILVDIGLKFKGAIEQLKKATEKNSLKIDKIVVCSLLGTDKSKIYYEKLEYFKRIDIKAPFCFIIPGKMHFFEEEFLKKKCSIGR